jgi:glycosyltransferase involved in cell wall biosynthesis
VSAPPPPSPSSPPPLTVVIPTLNEAGQIAECIGTLTWAAEVIVVDAASTDGTAEVARRAGATVVADGARGIAAQRNAGIAAARHPWVFALDADERIGDALARELRDTVAAPRHEAYGVKRRNLFHGHPLHRGHWGRDWVVRLFRRDRRFGGASAHPGLQGVTDVGRLREELDHTPYRDLAHHLEKLVAYGQLGAADLAAAGRRARWSDLTLRPAFRFWRDYLLHGSVFDGRLGVMHAGLSAVGVFLKYAFLWEREGRP